VRKGCGDLPHSYCPLSSRPAAPVRVQVFNMVRPCIPLSTAPDAPTILRLTGLSPPPPAMCACVGPYLATLAWASGARHRQPPLARQE
jgi:hypothetical protein